MIVVADTSPINYLVLIEQIHILSALYESVLIPQAVQDELLDGAAPIRVRAWVTSAPKWFKVRPSKEHAGQMTDRLDAGERAAIILAGEVQADYLLIDELLGRREAQARGLRVIGTLGVLRAAADIGLLDLADAVESLRATSFHVAPSVLRRLIDGK